MKKRWTIGTFTHWALAVVASGYVIPNYFFQRTVPFHEGYDRSILIFFIFIFPNLIALVCLAFANATTPAQETQIVPQEKRVFILLFATAVCIFFLACFENALADDYISSVAPQRAQGAQSVVRR